MTFFNFFRKCPKPIWHYKPEGTADVSGCLPTILIIGDKAVSLEALRESLNVVGIEVMEIRRN